MTASISKQTTVLDCVLHPSILEINDSKTKEYCDFGKDHEKYILEMIEKEKIDDDERVVVEVDIDKKEDMIKAFDVKLTELLKEKVTENINNDLKDAAKFILRLNFGECKQTTCN